ncbi:MAG: hypothetical protein J7K26_03285 [Candidatus Aenigmarchaeota archaeon]|nr:hypothetical protein [Candidatus Aenigmarchaeota archaeon]
MKKGIMIPIGGIIVFLITVIIAVVYVNSIGGDETIIKTDYAFYDVNEAHFIRRIGDVSYNLITQKAIYQLCEKGGGFEYWDEIPSESELKQKLIEKINTIASSTFIDYKNSRGYNIDFGELTLDDLLIQDNYLILRGKQDFSVSKTGFKIDSNIPIDQRIDTNYFNMIHTITPLIEDIKNKVEDKEIIRYEFVDKITEILDIIENYQYSLVPYSSENYVEISIWEDCDTYCKGVEIDENSEQIPFVLKIKLHYPENSAPIVDFDYQCDKLACVFNSVVSDPDGDRDINTYEWFVSGSSVSSEEALSYTFSRSGVRTVKLVVCDKSGACGNKQAHITVSDS